MEILSVEWVKEEIDKKLYYPIEEVLEKRIEELLNAATAATGKTFLGFSMDSRVLTRYGLSVIARTAVKYNTRLVFPPPNEEIRNKAQYLETIYNTLSSDSASINRFISKHEDTLPETIKRIPALSALLGSEYTDSHELTDEEKYISQVIARLSSLPLTL